MTWKEVSVAFVLSFSLFITIAYFITSYATLDLRFFWSDHPDAAAIRFFALGLSASVALGVVWNDLIGLLGERGKR